MLKEKQKVRANPDFVKHWDNTSGQPFSFSFNLLSKNVIAKISEINQIEDYICVLYITEEGRKGSIYLKENGCYIKTDVPFF